ncbi:MAG: flagellar basal body P-ring protein FlgI [Spirochaetota bacterium]|nr:flagellar basal body P-ring protein FlgI [Spirochaetota bacterium]
MKTKRIVFICTIFAFISISCISLYSQEAATVKIRDIAAFEGVRENQLVGFGLVTGLGGQGDSTRSELVKKMLANFMQSFGVQIDSGDVQSKNSAAVVVTATAPTFAREGQKLDVDVSSLLDARSLEGGILLQTNLKAANGTVYAVAQGRVVSVEKDPATRTVGRILAGGIMERDVVSDFHTGDAAVAVLLNSPDFTMAVRVMEVIEEKFPEYSVRAVDAEKIEIRPTAVDEFDPVRLNAEIGSLEVEPTFPARVVINRSSGVVVMGQNVRIAPVVISFKESELSVGWQRMSEESESSVHLDNTARVKDVVDVLTKAGLRVDDIIDVLQTIERAGALYGTLEVM